ncbi:hypothetical protein C8J57DRAFT_1481575 [Mycena rebaudengoi]|nr:hypothetical protein C8J57DRAFT_1481575 [Mycena rebaudengoi]
MSFPLWPPHFTSAKRLSLFLKSGGLSNSFGTRTFSSTFTNRYNIATRKMQQHMSRTTTLFIMACQVSEPRLTIGVLGKASGVVYSALIRKTLLSFGNIAKLCYPRRHFCKFLESFVSVSERFWAGAISGGVVDGVDGGASERTWGRSAKRRRFGTGGIRRVGGDRDGKRDRGEEDLDDDLDLRIYCRLDLDKSMGIQKKLEEGVESSWSGSAEEKRQWGREVGDENFPKLSGEGFPDAPLSKGKVELKGKMKVAQNVEASFLGSTKLAAMFSCVCFQLIGVSKSWVIVVFDYGVFVFC